MWLGQTMFYTLTNEEAKTTPESDCMRSVYRLSWTFFFLTCKNCDSKIEQHIILKFLVIEETTALSVEQFLAEKCIVSSLFTWPGTMRLYSFAKNKKSALKGTCFESGPEVETKTTALLRQIMHCFDQRKTRTQQCVVAEGERNWTVGFLH